MDNEFQTPRHCVLARGVDPQPGKRHAEAVLRAGVDDVSATTLPEAWDECDAAIQHAEDVDREGPLGIRTGHLGEPTRKADAGVVAEDVDAAELGPRALRERLGLSCRRPGRRRRLGRLAQAAQGQVDDLFDNST